LGKMWPFKKKQSQNTVTEKEIVMSKEKVVTQPHIVWQLSNDGLRPTEAPWGYVVRNPVMKMIPPGGVISVNLCVAANCPLIAFPTRSHQEDVTTTMLVMAGQEIVITVENKSKHAVLVLEDKEALVNIFPLLHAGSTSDTVG